MLQHPQLPCSWAYATTSPCVAQQTWQTKKHTHPHIHTHDRSREKRSARALGGQRWARGCVHAGSSHGSATTSLHSTLLSIRPEDVRRTLCHVCNLGSTGGVGSTDGCPSYSSRSVPSLMECYPSAPFPPRELTCCTKKRAATRLSMPPTAAPAVLFARAHGCALRSVEVEDGRQEAHGLGLFDGLDQRL